MVRQGQFFVIGALIIAAIIMSAVLAGVATITTPDTHTPRAVFDRSLDSFPDAVNLAYRENRSARHLEQRLVTALETGRAFIQGHGLSASMHAVLVVPGNTTTVIIGNAQGRPLQDVEITVNGSGEQLPPIRDGKSAVAGFTPAGNRFNVTVTASAGTTFTHAFRAGSELRGVYALRVAGEDQVWQETRLY